jgi:N-acetylglucosamine-6-phosphate deacetylase
MNDGVLSGWYYATRVPIELEWKNGIVTRLETARSKPPPDLWLTPALFDLQVNGYGGIDFQRDDLAASDLLSATAQLQSAGCTQFLLTLITDEWSALMRRLDHLRKLRAASKELQAAIAGWHIEGPFLSEEPGFHGAHNPKLMIDPSIEHLRHLRRVVEDDPVLLTLAPERRGALKIIPEAVALGIKVSLGHTNASLETLHKAVQAGATGFTHLGNACPKELDRHDNILWRAFETTGLTVGVIPDGIHVSPPLFRLIHRLMNSSSIYYTTDAMSAAGAPAGRYTIGNLELEVGADQIVRQPGRTNFAGSALRPIDGIFRAAAMLQRPWQEVWDALSIRPARLMDLSLGLGVGKSANFCAIKTTEANQFASLDVYVRGQPRTVRNDFGAGL